MDNQGNLTVKTLAIKKWLVWFIVIVVLGAILFIPYLRIPAKCIPCPSEMTYCPPCPTYNQSLAGYLRDKL
ncbi:MAG: hypothetical protein WCV50_01300 [Patescibacteria group bacterium]|jgi:hypothetical protein